jgi:hypothetical protein
MAQYGPGTRPMQRSLGPKERILAIALATASLTVSTLLLTGWYCAHSAPRWHRGQIPYWAIYRDFNDRLGGLNWSTTLASAIAVYGIPNWRWRALFSFCFVLGVSVALMISFEPQSAVE